MAAGTWASRPPAAAERLLSIARLFSACDGFGGRGRQRGRVLYSAKQSGRQASRYTDR